MRRLIATLLTLACSTVIARAQTGGIKWQTDPEEAVALAKKTQLPLMFYVLASSDDRDDKLETRQRKALADPRVIELSKRFVPVRLSRSRHRDLLKQIGLDQTANMEIAFTAPDGEALDRPLSAGGVANADSLAQKMGLVFNFHRQRVFDRELRPILENTDARPAELRTALERIREMTIVGADTSVAALLDRKGLDPKLASVCCDVLAHLSSKISVGKLLERSAAGDRDATEALGSCTPAAAEAMMEQLRDSGGSVRLDVYRAVGKICRIKSLKPDKWWTSAKDPLKEKEIERVTALAREASKRWQAENEYR